MANADVEIGGIIGEAWDKFAANKGFIISFFLCQFGIIVLLSTVSAVFKEASDGSRLMEAIGSAISLYLGVINIKACLDIYQGKAMKLGSSFFIKDGKAIVRYILSGLLVYLITLVGFILLIIPGIIWSLNYALVPYLALDKEMKVNEYLKESKRLMKGHRGNLILLGLVLSAINFLGLITFVVGLLVSIPVTVLAMVVFYKRIVEADTLVEAPVPPMQMPMPTPVPLPSTGYSGT